MLYDDREEGSAGVKFNDADLLGMPVRVTVSPRSIENGGAEVKRRTEKDRARGGVGGGGGGGARVGARLRRVADGLYRCSTALRTSRTCWSCSARLVICFGEVAGATHEAVRHGDEGAA